MRNVDVRLTCGTDCSQLHTLLNSLSGGDCNSVQVSVAGLLSLLMIHYH